jgi:hypothetical protein
MGAKKILFRLIFFQIRHQIKHLKVLPLVLFGYRRLNNLKYLFHLKNSEKAAKLKPLKVSSNYVVYTSIFGDYDQLKSIDIDSHDIEFFCFTDSDIEPVTPWKIIKVKPYFKHPRMDAKYYKLHPHEIFPNATHSLWIDASLQIQDINFFSFIKSNFSEANMALIPHPDRDNILDEAKVSIKMPKYLNLPIIEQVNHYKNLGFKDNNGLWACTIIWRQHNNSSVIKIMKQWWAENLIWSYQDQISLPFLLWRNSCEINKIDINLWKNKYFDWHHHRTHW